MATTVKLKETFGVESKHGAFYTGGNVMWHENTLFCQTRSNISFLNIDDGIVSKVVGEDDSEEADFIQTFTTDGTRLVSSHKSGLLKMWNINGELEKIWKYIHKGPIAKLVIKDNKLVSGGSDGIVRFWDLVYQACLLSFKGAQGVVNVVCLHPTEELLFASGDDGKVLSWRLDKKDAPAIAYSAHYSKVTSIVFANDPKHFVTVGRDKVIILWEVGKPTAIRTIPTYEAIEVIVSLPLKFKVPGYKSDGSIHVASAGETGVVKIWNVSAAKEVYVQSDSLVNKAQEEGGLAISNILFDETSNALAVVTVDQNIIIHNLKSFVCLKQFIGFSDEILDLAFVGENNSHLAVATNSNDIKLYENANMSCQLLKGHTDIVLALSTSKSNPNLMLSSGKDNTVRLWCLLKDNQMVCKAVGLRHTSSVGSVAFSHSLKFAVSASQDASLKTWEIPKNLFEETSIYLSCTNTQVAHDKDINCVTVAPNDRLIASASQDKTAKLWTDSLALVGVLRGHKRGVWCVKFSPADQVVLTSSADCTIKLWSAVEFSCLKTLEGHESSVLRADFLSNGLQIISAGADGLLKLFNIKTSECVSTLDQHQDRIWALAVQKDEQIVVSGGSDSFLIKWRDLTEEKKLERQKEAEEQAIQEQQLNNYLHNDELLKALKLALRLNKPFKVLRIIQGVIKKGDGGLADAIKELREDQKESLLKCATTWNMNSRNCHAAQLVMNVLINEMKNGEFRPIGLGATLDAALPYTERHFRRLTQLMQDLNLFTYTINRMQPHTKKVDYM